MYYFYSVAGWHHRVNQQNGAGLGFYRITPLLRREAQLVKLQVDSGDLVRAPSCVRREAAPKKCWDEYIDGTLQTSVFLHKVSSLYAPRLDNWVL